MWDLFMEPILIGYIICPFLRAWQQLWRHFFNLGASLDRLDARLVSSNEALACWRAANRVLES